MSNTGCGSQLSVTRKSSGVNPPNTPHSTFTVSPSEKLVNKGLAGLKCMTGALVSWTLMLWLHCAVLPHASTAVQVRTMVFSCGHLPGRVFSVKLTFG